MSGNQGQQNSSASGNGGGGKGLMTQADASRIQGGQVSFSILLFFLVEVSQGVLLIDS
jgi:hypothetical protein